jgi:hypothetical protein
MRTLATRDACARAAGMRDVSKLYRWLARGKRARSGEYREFYELTVRAEAEGEVAAMALITKAGQPRTVTKVTVGPKGTTTTTEQVEGDWKANAWRLERLKPKKYGERRRVTHAGDSEAPPVRFELEIPKPPYFDRRDDGRDDDEND